MTKPYVALHSPSGRRLTVVSPPDHPWQRALWFAIKYVNGENFWEEPPGEPWGDQVEVGDRIEWRRPTGEVVIDERRRLDYYTFLGALDRRALDWTTTLVPRVDVVLDRTPYTTWGGYGGLTLRGAPDWSDTRMLLDDGSVHRRPEGIASRWCDLSGPDAGITFLDHPANPRHPVPWYGATRSRVYGEGWSNYLNAAFLFYEPMTLEAGQALTFRYRLMIHDGMWDADQAQSAWEEWAGA